jgi:multidrug resistance protein
MSILSVKSLLIPMISPLGSSILAPGVPLLMKEFKSDNQELAIFVVSIYVLGVALGPLILSPLSEIYGRAIVYNVTNFLFVVFAIGCAISPSLSVLIGLRFLMGFAGSAPTTVGAGTIADLFKPQDRGKATSLYAIGPIVGPVLGPLIGGYLAQSKGWRWVPWFMAILVRGRSRLQE